MNKCGHSLLVILMIFSFRALAQSDRQLEDLDKASLEEIEYDIQLNDAKIAQEKDELSGIALKTFDTSDDKGKYSFLYHVNMSLANFSTISAFEFIYSSRYDWGWVDYSIVRTSAQMANISVYNSSINALEDGLFETTDTITEIGVGLSYRSKYIQHIINADSLFETIGASVEYVDFSENFFEEGYSGIGLKTDFGIHIRSSKAFHYGLKMAYHMASVKKSETVAGESDTTRALLLRWLSLGADLTFYY